MVTTTVRMLDGVHRNTSDAGPLVLLGVELVVRVVGLEKRLVNSLAAGNDTDHGSAAALDGLADTRGKSDTSLLSVLGVADDDGGGAGGAGEDATVTELGLNVGDDGALRQRVDGEDVTDGQRSY